MSPVSMFTQAGGRGTVTHAGCGGVVQAGFPMVCGKCTRRIEDAQELVHAERIRVDQETAHWDRVA